MFKWDQLKDKGDHNYNNDNDKRQKANMLIIERRFLYTYKESLGKN